MGYGRFDRTIPMPSQGDITVKGPFDPEDEKVDEADVLFLIVQGKGEDTGVVKGLGKWKRGENNNDWIDHEVSRWGEKPDGNPREFLTGEVARGIALAIVVRPGKLFREESPSQSAPGPVIFDPPQIEGVTWCADFMFESPGQAT